MEEKIDFAWKKFLASDCKSKEQNLKVHWRHYMFEDLKHIKLS